MAVRLASRIINGWQKMGSHRDESDSTEVRNPTLGYYGLTRRCCQILGPNTRHLVNAHIWPHHNRGNLDLMELQESDIDNPKNILRLHKTIEQHFDQINIMFEDTGGTTGSRQVRLKILNNEVRTTVLEQKLWVTSMVVFFFSQWEHALEPFPWNACSFRP